MLTNEPKNDFCGSDCVERFLSDCLTAEQLAGFENHLENCAACRRELNVRAADEIWWSQARDCLGESKHGATSSDDAAPRQADGTRSWDARSADITVEAQSTLAAIKPYLSPTDDPRMMGRIGTYEIVGLIGSGGNGVVLKGFDAALHRYVAIKLLSPRLADSGAARRRFSREAQAAAAVVHENVMAIHAVAETQGLPYLVMPYARGPSLEKRLRSGGPLALEEILRVGRQVAAGLSAAHAQGLVHRDIKPANILLEEGVARVKITDFGLARAADDASLTRSGVIAGTPQYMSPEQARGEPVDQLTDLFSLGGVLYACCTGRSPFRAETSYGVLRRICESEASSIRDVNPAVPGWLERLVERLLAKDPADRYASAAEVAALLERCLAHVQQPTLVRLPEELVKQASGRSWRSCVAVVGRRGTIAAAIAAAMFGAATVKWFAFPPLPVQRSSREAGHAGAAVQRRIDSEDGDSVDAAGAAANPPSAGGSDLWQDGIDEKISALYSLVEQLQAESSDDLRNNAIEVSIGELQRDLDYLQAEVTVDGSSPDRKDAQSEGTRE